MENCHERMRFNDLTMQFEVWKKICKIIRVSDEKQLKEMRLTCKLIEAAATPILFEKVRISQAVEKAKKIALHPRFSEYVRTVYLANVLERENQNNGAEKEMQHSIEKLYLMGIRFPWVFFLKINGITKKFKISDVFPNLIHVRLLKSISLRQSCFEGLENLVTLWYEAYQESDLKILLTLREKCPNIKSVFIQLQSNDAANNFIIPDMIVFDPSDLQGLLKATTNVKESKINALEFVFEQGKSMQVHSVIEFCTGQYLAHQINLNFGLELIRLMEKESLEVYAVQDFDLKNLSFSIC